MRKVNGGILFYSMDVGHVTNKRIRLLLNDHGPTGYWVWHCIIDHAYKVDGYFHKADNDDIELLSADVCRQPPEMVYRIIESCVKRGIFDRRVFEKCNVLTSDRMQINYINATYDRRRKGSSIYFSEPHFIISQQDISIFSEKQLEGIYVLETQKPIRSIYDPSVDNPRTSTEQSLFSTEKQIISTENTGISVHRRKEKKGEEKKREYSDTIVSPANAGQEKGVIDLKSNDNKEIGQLAKKSSGKKEKKPTREKKKNPDSEPYWQVLRRVWVDFNLKHLHFKVEPIPKADYSFMHRIIEKLRERATDHGVPWTEQEAAVRWEKFLCAAFNGDKWLHDHFEMKNLTTQMQSIFKLSENGHSTTHVVGKTIKFDKL